MQNKGIFVVGGLAAVALIYAKLRAKAAPPTEDIVVIGISFDPPVGTVGQQVKIHAVAENTGDVSGSTWVICTVEGSQVGSVVVSIGPGEQKEVVFTFTPSEAGPYLVEVNELSATLEVEGLPPEPAAFEVQGFTLGKREVNLYEPVSFYFDLVNVGAEAGYVDQAVCAMTGADSYPAIRTTIAPSQRFTASGTLYPRTIGTYYPTIGLIYLAGDDPHWIFTSSEGITVH